MNRPNPRAPLSQDEQRKFSALILLDRIIAAPGTLHAALLGKDDAFLEPLFDYLMAEDLAEVGDDDHFRATRKGNRAYQQLMHQQKSYLVHFDIYAAVDLSEGTFGDATMDDLEDGRWSDMRVAVAEYKGIDPYRMVFLSILSDGGYFENPDWKYDLSLGSNFFTELGDIVASQIRVEELGYETEEGEHVPGEAVMEDIILQGAQENRTRLESARRQQEMFEEAEGRPHPATDQQQEPAYDAAGQVIWQPYQPWSPMDGYLASALFVESFWHAPYW